MVTKLSRWLEENGRTRFDLAIETRIDPSKISAFATGRKRPSLVNALKIERATGGAVPAESWVGEDETNPHFVLPKPDGEK